nr:hypothetical protein [Allomuricauda sp.]
MRHLKRWCIAASILLFYACWPTDDDDDVNIDPIFQSVYEPVYLSRANLENSILLKDPEPIVNSGKIYIKDNLLFVNEVRKGFHVFDNSNPQNPLKIKFIKVPGSSDLAVRQNMLYINQATDLVAVQFDLNSTELTVAKRVKEAFPVLLSPDGFYAYDIPENSIVVDWELKRMNQ